MLLVAYLANTKWRKKTEKWLEPWHMGTHLRVPSECYPMNTNKTGFSAAFQKSLHLCALYKSSLCIGKVKMNGTGIVLFQKNDAKTLKNDWNPGTWVLFWEYSVNAI